MRLPILFLLTGVSVLFVSEIVDAADKRPNFLFVLVDDLSPESLSMYGNKVCQTPNLDRLAAEGIVLDDAHHMGAWSGAVCTASRTMIMTGRTVWRVPGARGPGLSFPKSFRKKSAEHCLAAVFNRAGYDTMRTCKRGNSFEEANARFTVRKDATKRAGTPEGGSEWHGDQVMAYLKQRRASKDSDPFLIYFGFSHPHDPRNAPPKLAEKYGANNSGPTGAPNPKAPPLPINYLPAHPFHHGHPGLRDEVKVQGVMEKRDETTVRNEIGREYGCVENIDIQIGRVLKQLETTGELANTYVIFTSDHGMSVGRHGLMGKQNLYEHTWKVPFIVRGPGIKAGTRASGYTYLLDVFPTLCDYAGIDIPKTVEGKSFRPVLEGKSARVRDVVYGVYSGGTKPGMRSVKTNGWKLIEYDVLEGEVRKTQLFDLAKNPNELLAEHHAAELKGLLKNSPESHQKNLANVSEFKAKRAEMETLLKSEMKRLGDPYTLSSNSK
jgi:choline-sulfatase